MTEATEHFCKDPLSLHVGSHSEVLMIRTSNIPCGEDTIQLLMARQPGEWAPPPHSWTLVGLSFPPIQAMLPSCPAGKGKQQ